MNGPKIAAMAFLCAALGACANQAPPPPPSVALPAAPPPGEPAWIINMDAQALRTAFGQPAFVRKDNGSEMWRYDGTTCKAFFFLYRGVSGASIVRHVETLPRGSAIAADENCLALLRLHPVAPALNAPSS
ncbi:MAG TPA: hypothetical protein VMD53_04465 [Rhizomicrobium sp.]|nr:hypothetical protein [Rhizomicrobium sp.]